MKHENSKKVILPSVELPKGGGAIQSIGEKFSVNAVTGSGTASIPLPVSTGRNGFTPNLSLSYDSSAGNSSFGLGWSLSLPTITRKTSKGLPIYNNDDESDVFIIAGMEDFVPFLRKNGKLWEPKIETSLDNDYTIYYYRPRTEGGFAKIEKWVNNSDNNDIHWRVTTRENSTQIYGKSESARISDTTQKRIFSWLLEESHDNRGNIIHYEYVAENKQNISVSLPSEALRLETGESFTQKYIKTISYCNQEYNKAGGWHFQVVFDYGDHDEINPQPEDYLNQNYSWDVRQDPFSTYRSGFEIRTYRLCKRVLMFHQFDQLNSNKPTLVESTNFVHDNSGVVSTLTEAFQQGYIWRESTYSTKRTPAVKFSYSKSVIGQKIQSLSKESVRNMPEGVQDAYQFVDLEGEGLTGILVAQNGGWHYKSNKGNGEFGEMKLVSKQPSLQSKGIVQLQDVDGDGNKELVLMNDQINGYYTYKNSNWEEFRPFKEMPSIDWKDPNLRLIDLSGDGFADILITEDDTLRWFPSKNREGYEQSRRVNKSKKEENGPAIVFADSSESIYLADLSGDGLSDIVRIRNKDICYWPNLGYGRFGQKIVMNSAPSFDFPDLFNPSNIRLADINGTGTTDILYFNSNGAQFWINESGNGWGEPQRLDQFPMVDSIANVQFADIIGTGTPCLVWSSLSPIDAGNPIKFIDLMEGSEQKPVGKPYLLNEINNNMGAINRFYYAPSTKFYIQDKKAGTPWITKLHFPVYVIEKKEIIDEISQSRLVTTYSYHHGYFDPIEREFRGFGRVNQLDSESFEEFELTAPNDEQKEHFIHPILTKTWFHTGAYIGQNKISRLFKDEYFQESSVGNSTDSQENYLLEDSIIEPLDESEFDLHSEAHRAMRGQSLRQEIYALDGSEKETTPYTVSETNFIVREIQPKQELRHGVFMPIPNESISFNYERDCCDPRVSHTISVEVDKYGTALQNAEIVYPRRRNGRTDLPEEQLTQHIILSSNTVAHIDNNNDYYMLGIPVESKSYEISGVFPDRDYFSAQEFRSKLAEIESEVPNHNSIETGNKKKSLLAWNQQYFWNKNQTEKLPHTKVDWPLLPHHSEAAVFTSERIKEAFGDRLKEKEIRSEGGYTFRENYWWNPGEIIHFSYHDDPNSDDRNRENPFLFPIETQGVFELVGTENKRARVFYDDYNLGLSSVDNEEGHTTSAEIDYRTLAPTKMIDENENISEAITDELGLVIAVTSYGTQEQDNGSIILNGDDPIDEYNRIVPLSVDEVVANPHQFLQGASSFFFYDVDAWKTRKAPPQFVSIVRETHARMLTNSVESVVQIALGFSDGFGRELQQKIKVEEGLAFKSDSSGGLLKDANGDPRKEFSNERWLSSGRTILNNKEKPIKQYEPFYIDSHVYLKEDQLPKIGVTNVMHYDPLMRAIRTDTPKGFFSKIEFTSWDSTIYDVNDTIKDSDYYKNVLNGTLLISEEEKSAMKKAEKHYDTPSKTIFDSLGRPFLTISLDEKGEEYHTRIQFNNIGKPLNITDSRQIDLNRLPERQNAPIYNYEHIYDMMGNPLSTKSIDAGESRAFVNVLGNPVYSWMPRGYKNSVEYDWLQRPIKICTENGDLAGKITVEKMVYADPTTSSSKNLRGALIAHFDQSGKSEVVRVGFKGDTLKSKKRFLSLFEPNGTGLLRTNLGSTLNWDELSESDLEAQEFVEESETDALGRVLIATSSDGSIHKPTFNYSGQLKKVEVKMKGEIDFVEYVSNIEYSEKGQRTSIRYGNGVNTSYKYDPISYQLTGLKSVRSNGREVLQDLSYWYDPVGNISRITDRAQQDIFFDNQVVKAANDYTYDAFYQLRSASGREHIGQTALTSPEDQVDQMKVLAHKSDGQKMRNYERFFEYDKAGNMLLSHHKPSGSSSYKRQFKYALDSNRLEKSGIGQEQKWQNYTYDAAGNMQQLIHLKTISWNSKNEIQAIEKSGVTAIYEYDSDGERTRKIVKKGAKKIEVRYYVGDVEIFRRYDVENPEIQLERVSLHIMDDSQRIAMVDTQTIGKNGTSSGAEMQHLIRYQLGNHLGSASIEIDGKAKIISYEEFYPYGSSSFQSVDKTREIPRKRYRYTGMERDEESGLNYHSARYYAPWLCRWLKPDPAGTVDGLNVFLFVSNKPIRKVDPSGLGETDTSHVNPKKLKSSRVKLNKYVNRRMRASIKKLKLSPTRLMTSEQRKQFVFEVSQLGIPRGADFLSSLQSFLTMDGGPNKSHIEKWAGNNLPNKKPGGKYEGATLLQGPAWWVGQTAVNPSIVLESNGTYFAVGTDKLGHFFAQGFEYFEIAREKGVEAALMYGIRTELGKFGLRTTGVFSYADLEANEDGLKFYQDLYNNPFLIFDISDYASLMWNEEHNENIYSISMQLFFSIKSLYNGGVGIANGFKSMFTEIDTLTSDFKDVLGGLTMFADRVSETINVIETAIDEVKQTVESVKSTVESAKSTVDTLGTIFSAFDFRGIP
ncbi:MAG: hypothetical protein COA33_000790 [Fluviicola sp.]|nr:hypothetical protein [Fluviicola sp.]